MSDRKIDTAISSLGRRELEQAVRGLAAALYRRDGQWDIDTEWEVETVEDAAHALPVRVRNAISEVVPE